MRSILARLALVGVACGVLAPMTAPAQPVFNSLAFALDAGRTPPEWRRVLDRLEAERPARERCLADPAACPNGSAARWAELVRTQRSAAPSAQLNAVHRFFNAYPYRTDDELWQRSDYWATPFEFLENAGDCEDYAIAKYVTLRTLGFAPDRMRLVVLRDTVRDVVHAVLAVETARDVLILDNLQNGLVSHRVLGHYLPYYSVNEGGRWAHVPKLADPVAAASR